MTIQITKPEVEALINERLQTGRFKDAEDVVFQALQSSPPTAAATPATRRAARERYCGALCAIARPQSGFRPQPIYRTTGGLVNGYLLDTNVPSEFSRDRPEPRVVQWLKTQPATTLFLSAVTIGEIRKGLIRASRKPPPFRA